MRSELENIVDMNRGKFAIVTNALLDILYDKDKIYSFLRLKSSEEAFEFLQTYYPGDYSEEDFAKVVVILLSKVYFDSSSYARNLLFLYNLEDMKKHEGIDLLKHLHMSQVKNKKGSYDDYSDVAGGAGNKKWIKSFAGGLAALVPFTSLNNQLLTPSASAVKTKRKTKDNKQNLENASLWSKIKNHKLFKPVVIIGGLALLGTGIWVGFGKDYFQEKAAKKQFEKEKLNLTFNALSSTVNRYSQNGKINESGQKILDKLLPGLGKAEDIAGANVIIDQKREELKKGGEKEKKELDDYAKKILDEEEEIKKRKKDANIIEGTPIASCGKAFSFAAGMGSFLKWIWNSSTGLIKDAKAVPETLQKSIEVSKDVNRMLEEYMYQQQSELWNKENKKVFNAGEVEEGLKKIIKGQDEQINCLASIVASFNMQAAMSDQSDNDRSGLTDSAQVNSQCVFLTGPSGTGKSLVASVVKRFLNRNIGYITINLSGYKGGGVNAYLASQKDLIRQLNRYRNRHVVIVIEEIDKASKDPVLANDISQWMHNVHDSGDIGGGEQAPVHFNGTLFFATSNELPSPNLLSAGKVKGLNILDKNGQHITSANKNNYLEILVELSKNSSRELPVERSGSLLTRSVVIEFKQTDDEAMKKIIDMHISELNEKISNISDGININMRYSEKFLDKLTKLRNSLIYKDGGSRTLVNDILRQIMSLVNSNKVKNIVDNYENKFSEGDEIPPCDVWLDYVGMGEDGKLKIDIKETQQEATCNGEVPDIYDDAVEGRNPDVAVYIQALILKELDKVLSNIEIAIDSKLIDDWNSVLTKDNETIVDKFLSMITTKLPENLEDKLKVLSSKRSQLITTLAQRGFSIDNDWKFISGLKTTVDSINDNFVSKNQLLKRSKKAISNLYGSMKKLEQMRENKCFKEKEETFVLSNKKAISQIYSSLIAGMEVSAPDYNIASQQLMELLKNKEDFMSSEIGLSKFQCDTVERFNSLIDEEFERVSQISSERAKVMCDIIDILNKDIKSKEDFQQDSLSKSDLEFLNYLTCMVDHIFASKKVEDQIYNLNLKRNILEKKLSEIGVSEDDIGSLRGLLSKIGDQNEVFG